MPHVINAAAVADSHVRHLQGLSDELDKHIVILSGGGARVPFDVSSIASWQNWIGSALVTPLGEDPWQQLADNAIAVWSWSGSAARWLDHQTTPFPAALWSDQEARVCALRDHMCDWQPRRRANDNMGLHDPVRYTTTEPFYLEDERYPDHGYLIGEVGPRQVWFHYEIRHIPELRRFQFGLWWDHAIRRSANDEFAAELEERTTTLAREAFINFMGEGRLSNRVRSIRQVISDNERSITDFRAAIARNQTQLTDSQRELDALMQLINSDGHSWDEYWERLVAHPRIQTIRWEEPNLVFRTDEVRLHHPSAGTTATLGTMEVIINLRDMLINIENLTNPRGGRPHPHVDSGNQPCFGEYGHSINQMLANGDLTGLIELLFVYLETFNPHDDWGRYGAYWFQNDGTPIGDDRADEAVQAANDGRVLA